MNNYIIHETLNSGQFGRVVKAENRFTKKLVAIKIEKKSVNTLKYESEIYNFLTGISNIPKLKGFVSDDENNYLIIELYNYNLITYKNNIYNDKKLGNVVASDITNLTIKLINILKDIHQKGILHRDIKPENICFKNNEPYIIDFGMAKTFINNNKHIDEKKINSIIGTPNYVSINVINMIEPSRRDDLESLIYIMIFLLLDKNTLLQLHDLPLSEQKNAKVINNFLHDNSFKIIVNKYIEYCRLLKFIDVPDYNYIIELLNNYSN